VVLTSAASSANSGVFSTSRMLYGLALKGDAPNPSTACRAAACRRAACCSPASACWAAPS
jgi:L-asparagine transporter-like permease